MKNNETLYLKIKEGSNQNYFEAIEEALNLKSENNRLSYKKGVNQFIISSYTMLRDFEIMVTQANYDFNIVIDRTPDGMPDYYHINIVKEGKVLQDYNDEQQVMETGTPKGIFVYNGLFPLKSAFQANHQHQTISFKLSKRDLKEVMPEAIPLFDTIFENDEPKGYHTHISPNMTRVINDLLHYENSDYGRILMVNAKAFELFTIITKSMQDALSKDELHGLHIDDYNRLMQIKERIMQKLTSKISIEELADEFAVSVSKLQRDFKALFDCSVYQFYTRAKMDEAHRRLKTGEYTVMEVGYDMGYNSLSKFSEMFKKVKGISPKDVLTQ